ncbi:prolipoprotein diacylglyceryl transferase [Hymenobacter sp. BT664]|uniref:Prolipoprotein diacylglyceryl transferase n=1 Tax=Hymenobacter montanus TaxID=2771359 RepID=A0A927BGP9_9BACT|nr:prolipoprotein diacylglyceryl transferase family protein [Hymenobacter montanus]MBD2769950.1 prolipoprotein diacylglyceryl transferase [Hymenobacter montanus]
MNTLLGKLAYGLAFCAVLPAVLVWWALRTAALVPLPVPHTPLAGAACTGGGVLLMVWGMGSLWFRGGGLPMNAFPPVRFVASGLYGLLPHPIYVGASLLSVGVSLLAGSASGLWLVSPVLTLAWLALVYGFENADLRQRFPHRPVGGSLVSLPPATAALAPLAQRLRVAAVVFGPWLLLYETVIFLGPSRSPVSTFLGVEQSWPVWQWSEGLYLLAYPFAVLTPFVIKSPCLLRQFAVVGWLATWVGVLLQLSLPLVAVPRPFVATTLWGELLQLERATDGVTAALPSFHVLWAAVAGHFWGRRFPRLRAVSFALAVAISASCLATGMHSLLDVAGGVVVAALVIRYRSGWRWLQLGLERFANSWSARQVGPLRIINHSWYAGLAMLMGVLLVGCLLPDVWALLPPVLLGVLGAGLWGQLVEGASGLSRPFGYYGSLLGGLAGCLVAAQLTRFSFFEVVAAFTVALPLVQGVGRARCLIQGCCHGRATANRVGIRVTHPKSRICALAQLAGQPVHATPAYSMLANLVVGLVLFRLAYEHAPAPLLIGVYLILTGLARFVEEQFRGEPQTPRMGGLKLYQWLAFGMVMAGLGTTMLSTAASALQFEWYPTAIPVALGAALLAAFAMGMDFPFSTKRFSRLASA